MAKKKTNDITLTDIAETLDKGFEHVGKEIAGVKADVAGLKIDVGHLKGDVGTLKGDVGHLKADVAGMKDGMGAMLEELNATHADVRYVKRTVDILTRSDAAQDAAIKQLSVRVHRIEKKVGLAK